MPKTTPEQYKAIVLEAFDTLFNKRDYEAAERFWSPKYIQHSAHIGPGREGLFGLIRASPPTLKWERGVILAEGDYVIVHSRYSGTGLPSAWLTPAFAVIIVAALFLTSYRTMARVFKWLTLVLFAYVITAFLAHPDWWAVLRATFVPDLRWSREFLSVLVAILMA